MTGTTVDIKRYAKAALTFFAASAVIMIFIPRNGLFEYEFGRGKQWAYDDLSAPFDFPVYKTETEIQNERRTVNETSTRYYNIDTLKGESILNRLKETLSSSGDYGEALYLCLRQSFSEVYERGIIDPTKSDDNTLTAIVRGNETMNYPVSELFTPTTAYDFVIGAILRDRRSDKLKALADSIDLKKYISVNLTSNDALTAAVNRKLLNNILPTEGMVLKGNKIISRNEIVTDDIFKILSSLKLEFDNAENKGNRILLFMGKFIFVVCCMGAIFLILFNYMKNMLLDSKCLYFTTTLITLFVCLSLWVIEISPIHVFIVPLTIVPVYISSFFYSRPAIFIHVFVTLLIGCFTASSFEFVLLTILSGVTAVIGFKHSYRRWQLFLVAFLIFLTYTLTYLTLRLLRHGDFSNINKYLILLFGINCLIIIVLFQFTFIFERLFGFVSDSRLVELSDTNQKLLRLLSETVPGTAQHVMQVANLSEAVIREIGGNHLLIRTGALYHDIGKMKNPRFFIENQISGINPHSDIPPEESAEIIIDHVVFGVELAKKHNLPEVIIDFIKTHHGLSKVYFFYSKYLEEHPDEKESEETVARFTYPGPNPSTKETAVVMIADACEAASRSLKNPDKNSINALVDKIVSIQSAEGCLDNSNLTLRELSIAKSVIKSKLQNIYHSRVEYPDRK